LKKTTNLKGVLVFHEPEDQNDIIAAVDVNVLINESTSISLLKETSSSNLEGLWFYVLTAFLGGLILNCMPCVLPVISLKIMSFVNMAGESRSKTFKHGLVFSIGVLMSFWVLAGALLTLQAYGHLVGWGFQLQNALFVGTLAIVIFIFSLSLFGIFEFGAVFASWAGKGQVKTNKTGSESVTGSFFSGILATAVATPCTGPFLGSAIGFAVTQPPLWALIVFTSLGLGMASPYLILAAFPSLLRFIPKPGNWMVTFKEISGFIMLATVIWLLWVFTAQTSHYSLFIMMGALFLFAIGCWVSGKWASPVKKQRIRVIGTSLALIFFAFGGVLAYEAATVEEMNETEWEVFSPERLAQLRTEGTPVFVDFTAKWCLICQQNHLVLSNDRVAKKFKELGVVRMKADWTKHDPTITNTLRLFGRNGVPLYIVYNGNTHQDAEVLPQVLTPDLVIAQLDKLEPAKK
jgi:thiol:disulfide interchange protein